jgi:hypothetical protein
MKENAPLKRKALDDFMDNSQLPTRKRRACASYRLQAPVAFVTRDISKPAKARRGTLSRSYAIADLNAIPLVRSSRIYFAQVSLYFAGRVGSRMSIRRRRKPSARA